MNKRERNILQIVLDILSKKCICPKCKAGVIGLHEDDDDDPCVSCSKCEGIWNIGEIIEDKL
jgi:hypothetical protein